MMSGLEGQDGDANVLRLDDEDIGMMQGEEDAFTAQMKLPNMPIVVDREMLLNLNFSEVLVRRWPNPVVPTQYFRIIDPMADVICGPCGHFFEADEFDMYSLAEGKRPFSWDPMPVQPE